MRTHIAYTQHWTWLELALKKSNESITWQAFQEWQRQGQRCLSHDVSSSTAVRLITHRRRKRERERKEADKLFHFPSPTKCDFALSTWHACYRGTRGERGGGEGTLGYLAIYNAWLLLCVFAFNEQRAGNHTNLWSMDTAKYSSIKIYIYIYYIYPLYIPVLIVRFAHQFSFLHIKLASSFAAAFDIENRIPNYSCIFTGDYAYAV